jgi:hypothetical protein
LKTLRDRAAAAGRQAEDVLERDRRAITERAFLAGIPRARLLSSTIVLDGSPSKRLAVKRIGVGHEVETPLTAFVGLTRCVTPAGDVQNLWRHLLDSEAASEDRSLRGAPSTILEIPDATASIEETGSLHVSVTEAPQPRAVLAIPQFTFDCPPRKIANFSHWLLDCLPQIATLMTVGPDTVFLLPPLSRGFHHATLSLAGLKEEQRVVWDGKPTSARRLLVFESDGRAGGGRPLSPLIELRHKLEGSNGTQRSNRRLFVSRRDAKRDRRWLSNEDDVEALFRSRGFDILCVSEYPFHELVTLFREARVVAGLNGAGLAHVLFSSSRTDLIVLLTDSLIRWYAAERGARSLWAGAGDVTRGRLSEFGDSPRFYAHVAAAFEQRCHSFVSADQMPIEQLASFLDEVLAQVGSE